MNRAMIARMLFAVVAALPLLAQQAITVNYTPDPAAPNFVGSSTTVTVLVTSSIDVLNPTASGALNLSGSANLSITEESFPMEYSITGRANSATASRRI